MLAPPLHFPAQKKDSAGRAPAWEMGNRGPDTTATPRLSQKVALIDGSEEI